MRGGQRTSKNDKRERVSIDMDYWEWKRVCVEKVSRETKSIRG